MKVNKTSIYEKVNLSLFIEVITIYARRKGNPLTLLVGMQTSTATMEYSVEIP